ncbi:MAG: hypothetical protein AAFX81_11990 [Pseudomonadota bacterium]
MTTRQEIRIAAAVLPLLGAGEAVGQSLAPPTFNDEAWRVSITPYLFLPVTTTGTSTVADGSVDIDLDLGDLFDVLNGAIAGRAEAWRGDFGLVTEGYFVSIGGDSSIDLPGPAGGTTAVDVKVKQAFVDLLGAYRVVGDTYDETDRRYALDVQAGARFNSLTQDVDAKLNVNIGSGAGFQRDLGGTESWWEPVIGARGMAELSERWTAALLADFSGFGVNGDDLQWKVRAGLDYRPWEHASFRFGWQFYGMNFSTNRDDGKFAYDVFQTGPFLAFTYQFQ